MSRPVSRILSSRGTGDHPSATDVAARLRRMRRATYPDASREQRSNDVRGPKPFLVLLRVGFAEPSRSLGTLVVSYTAVSPLPVARRSVLCGTVPRVTPGGRYPPPCSSESGLSSALLPRSPGRLIRHLVYGTARRPCTGGVIPDGYSPSTSRWPSDRCAWARGASHLAHPCRDTARWALPTQSDGLSPRLVRDWVEDTNPSWRGGGRRGGGGWGAHPPLSSGVPKRSWASVARPPRHSDRLPRGDTRTC
jgi:hypothetical protein